MKLFKKLVAVVAMAAICCTMTAPAVASAAPATCTHVLADVLVSEVLQSSYEHTYYYLYDVDGDGDMETVLDECTVSTVTYTYERKCICGLRSEGTYSETITEHSKDCGVEE